jgi:hypothetical protein
LETSRAHYEVPAIPHVERQTAFGYCSTRAERRVSRVRSQLSVVDSTG